MTETGERVLNALTPAQRSELGWSLKNLCYGAWTTEPQRAIAAADALRSLVDASSPDEVDALADWTAGIAALIRGEMADADARFVDAASGFRALGQDHHAAETQVPRIMALAMLGAHAKAASCAEATQRTFVALGDTVAAGKVSLNLGSLRLRQDDFSEAARHYREAAVLFARAGDRQHSVMADIGLADALTALGDFDEAMRIYARATMRAETHGLPVLEAMIQESVGLLELARGRYRAALAGFESSRRAYETLGMPQQLAIAEKQLADAYLELHLLPEAIKLFDRALDEFRTLDMPDDLAWTLAQRGRALLFAGNVGDAGDSLIAAGEAFGRSENAVGGAAVLLARAELELLAGHPDKALELAAKSELQFEKALLPDRVVRAAAVRAESLLGLDRNDEARALFAATLDRARELQLLAMQVRCLTGQGAAASEANDATAARDALSAAIELFEQMRQTLPGDEIRSAFLTDHLRPYRLLLTLTLDELPELAPPESAAQVLRQLDRLRARSLGERMAQSRPDDPAHGNTITAGLRARLNWLYRRVRRLEEEGSPSATLAAELRDTEHELLESTRRDRLAGIVSAAGARPHRVPGASTASGCEGVAGGDGDGLDLAFLQSALGADDALIEYGVNGDELIACIVHRSGVTLARRIAHWPDVVAAVRAVRFQLDTLRHGAEQVLRHLPVLTRRVETQLHVLHDMIWAPIAVHVDHATRIMIVPHGPLGSLPFSALRDGDTPLSMKHQLFSMPSARIATIGLAMQPLAPSRAVVLGDSTRLPHAATEATTVAGLYPGAKVLVGDRATIESLTVNIRGADVVHLACHAQYRSDNPMFSALHLVDGALTVEMAESLSLGAGTVVLSACETALAEQESGDEMVGLVRGFLLAGAARVLASLWPVDDRTTSIFMARFHRELSQGVDPGVALQRAQCEMRQTHPHPYYWAAFALHGRW